MSGRFRVHALIMLAILLAAGFLLVWNWRGALGNIALHVLVEFRKPLPEAVTREELNGEKVNGASELTLPVSINLDVPFTSQAPFENWDLPFKEACEEASLLMADAFYKGERFTKQGATNAIIALTNFQRNRFGYYEDTTAEETASIAREYFGYANVKVVPGPLTAEMIKKEIAQGRPVILPMAGRLLDNIYYRRPGPYYHMLVVKGYTPTEFITNDPGTKRGHNYRYPYKKLLDAIHDFDPLDIAAMPQAMIVIAE